MLTWKIIEVLPVHEMFRRDRNPLQLPLVVNAKNETKKKTFSNVIMLTADIYTRSITLFSLWVLNRMEMEEEK